MNAFARFEELINKQNYSVRTALAQINKESSLSTVTFDGEIAWFNDRGNKMVDDAKILVFFLNHETFA